MGSQERNDRYIVLFANALINPHTGKVMLIFHVMQVDSKVMNYEIYSCICTCMFACMRVCMRMYVLQCMCTCMYAFVRVCAYVSVYMYTCVHICTHVYVYLRICTMYVHIRMYLRVCTVQCFSTMLCTYCGMNVCCCCTYQNLHFYVVFGKVHKT